jgi:hypothetical protein
MVDETGANTTLGDVAARQLADAINAVPQPPGIKQRWARTQPGLTRRLHRHRRTKAQ